MKEWLRKFKKDERGLTLVELLAVIVILAIVGAIAFVMIGNVMENSRKDAHIANAQQLISAAKLYDASVEEITVDNSVLLGDLQTAGLIGEFTSPWSDTDYDVNGTSVTKRVSSGVVTYEVTIAGGNTDYPISGANEAKLNGGKDSFSDVWTN